MASNKKNRPVWMSKILLSEDTQGPVLLLELIYNIANRKATPVN